MDLHADIIGSGPNLLLLHGALMSRSMWEPNIDVLRTRYRLILCDLPGHGGSPDLPGDYTIPALTRAVGAFLDRSAIGATHVCGHSLGGMVAQQLAVDSPDRVEGLVLAETAFGTRSSAWERVQTALSIPMLRLMPQRVLVSLAVREYGALSPAVAHYIQREMSAFSRTQSVRIIGAALRFDGRSQLGQIRSSTLILAGSENSRTHRQAQLMSTLIADAQLEMIQPAHHLLNRDNPEAFSHALIRFLE